MRTLLLSLLLAAPALAQEKLTLDEAVRRALIRNSSAVIAQQEILRAEGILREQRAPSLPILTGNAVDTRIDSARSLAGRTLTPLVSLNANLTLTVPLIAPQHWVQWSHASDQVGVAQLSSEEVRRTVGVATARAYLGVMAQHRLVGVTTQARDNAKSHLDDAHARFEVGSGNRLDEVRAAQELATDESQLSAALAALDRSREALGVLVGEEGPVEVEQQVTLPAPPAPDDALREAEEKRADVRAQKLRTEVAHRVLRDSWADYMPLLSAVLQPFYQTPATVTVPQTGWQAQLVLTLPIFDGGARYGLRRERSALHAEAQADLENLLRQARSDVRAGFESLKRTDESLGSARRAAKLAHEALDMTMLAYREGATNDLEVVDAERRARDADTAALVAEDAARQARIDLLSASGRFP
ncbi:MAG: TolC family protein [Deltaproteobacteria bacterium]|nr:MAG: TolC family protein [Deltaproteobacteria bacterium]